MLKNSTMSRALQTVQLVQTVLHSRTAVLAAGMGAVLAVGGIGAGFAAAEAPAAQGPALSAQDPALSELVPATAGGGLAAVIQVQADMQKRAAHEAAADRGKRAAEARIVAKKAAAKKAAVKKSAAPKPADWVKPVTGYKLSAGFAQAGNMWSHKHSGQDFAVPTGTPVHAVRGGTVVTAGWGGAYGNNIVIKHADRTYSQYGHLSKIGLGVGQTVNTNQVIGLSGNTGNSSGPHLHFEIRTTPVYGSAIEPMAFLRSHGVNGL